jgi:hypothetical protein
MNTAFGDVHVSMVMHQGGFVNFTTDLLYEGKVVLSNNWGMSVHNFVKLGHDNTLEKCKTFIISKAHNLSATADLPHMITSEINEVIETSDGLFQLTEFEDRRGYVGFKVTTLDKGQDETSFSPFYPIEMFSSKEEKESIKNTFFTNFERDISDISSSSDFEDETYDE